MKHRFIVLVTALVVLLMYAPAYAYFVSTSAGDFDVTTTTGTFSALETLLDDQVWWGSGVLANEFAVAVNTNLGLPNSDVAGPFFAWEGDFLTFNAAVWHSNFGEVLGRVGMSNVTHTWAMTFQVVPLPTAAWLFGSALGLLGWMRRRTA